LRVGGDEGDGLAGVPHDVLAEDRLVVDVEENAVLAPDVRSGEHGDDAGDGGRHRGVDGGHPGVGEGRTARGAPQHPVAAQVAAVAERAGHLGHRVDPADAITDATARAHDARVAKRQMPR
jgi:hypothetical protein